LLHKKIERALKAVAAAVAARSASTRSAASLLPLSAARARRHSAVLAAAARCAWRRAVRPDALAAAFGASAGVARSESELFVKSGADAM
jgi:hypothetical protein